MESKHPKVVKRYSTIVRNATSDVAQERRQPAEPKTTHVHTFQTHMYVLSSSIKSPHVSKRRNSFIKREKEQPSTHARWMTVVAVQINST
mmetsp:Transcript_11820/g.21512  ORF Transcript_11820/g.21512 Transcript_11820/m.21512 type:complete len:90 (+) Transcript_11820:1360-1629(+)